ncbi:hypothetical protein [Kitasatospora cineracea]|uniref:hypothetical protein n=1 Tax=Kitasatospora cineracea TaxID=88074 RepID=UPI0013C2A3F6|nr:hypothetical protein [Kitasatospora cineracea]
MDDPGFDFSVLSEFRDRMAEGDRADGLLAVMVDRLAEAGLVKRRGRQRTDSTHVLAAVRRLDRTELVGETLRAALEELTAADEDWVSALVTDEWARRYGRPVRYDRLPKEAKEREQYALTVGEDGMRLFSALLAADAPARLRRLPQVEVLRQVWVQRYWYDEIGVLRQREPKQTRDRLSRRMTERRTASGAAAAGGSPAPASATTPWSSVEIVFPHDPQARFSHKPGKAEWVGYKDHQTETCDEGLPNVIVHVATTHRRPRRTSTPWRGSMPTSQPVLSLRPSTWSTAATSPRPPSTGPGPSTGSTWSARSGSAPGHGHCRASTRRISIPTGMTKHSLARTEQPVRPESRHSPTGTSGCRYSFPRAVCRSCEDRLKCTGNTAGRGWHILLLPQPLQEIQNRVRKEQNTQA